jgi:hypothetical protein
MGPGSGGSFGSGVSCGGSLMGACSGLVGRCPPILSMLSILASGPRDGRRSSGKGLLFFVKNKSGLTSATEPEYA